MARKIGVPAPPRTVFPKDIEREATLDQYGKYRYELSRRWREGDLMLWVMLNPSTADANIDDPTIRRCMGFALREDFAGIGVVNLYAERATKPDHLLDAEHPIGQYNKATIRAWFDRTDVGLVVAAWGAWHQSLNWRDRIPRLNVEGIARDAGRDLVCLGRTKMGAPRHPLYAPGDASFEPYTIEAYQ